MNQIQVDPFHKMIYLLTGKSPSEINRRDKAIKFPVKLMYVLQCGDYEHAVDWSHDGLLFVIKNSSVFESCVLPEIFKEAQFQSFERKLTRWGFTKARSNSTMKKAKYYGHPLFRRGNFSRCMKISTSKIACTDDRSDAFSVEDLARRASFLSRVNEAPAVFANTTMVGRPMNSDSMLRNSATNVNTSFLPPFSRGEVIESIPTCMPRLAAVAAPMPFDPSREVTMSTLGLFAHEQDRSSEQMCGRNNDYVQQQAFRNDSFNQQARYYNCQGDKSELRFAQNGTPSMRELSHQGSSLCSSSDSNGVPRYLSQQSCEQDSLAYCDIALLSNGMLGRGDYFRGTRQQEGLSNRTSDCGYYTTSPLGEMRRKNDSSIKSRIIPGVPSTLYNVQGYGRSSRTLDDTISRSWMRNPAFGINGKSQVYDDFEFSSMY